MKSGKRGWWILGLTLLFGLLAMTFWPSSSGIMWTYHAGGYSVPSNPTVASSGTIYIGTRRGELIALDSHGREKWQVNLGVALLSEAVMGPNGNIHVSLAGGGNFGGVASVNPAGATNWLFLDTSGVLAPPAIAPDGGIYFGGQASNLIALAADGTERWRYPAGSQITCSPVVAPGESVTFVSQNGFFRQLSLEGSLVMEHEWKRSTPSFVTALARSPEGFWVIAFSSQIIALEADGREKWVLDLKNFDPGASSTYLAPEVDAPPKFTPDGAIHFNAANGRVYSLDQDGKPLRSLAKGERAASSARRSSDFSVTAKGGMLLAHEDVFQVSRSVGSFTLGSRESALVEVDAAGREQWRQELRGRFNPLRLLNVWNFAMERQLGFGTRRHQGLSRPVTGPDGTIYVSFSAGLHAIRPPKPE